MPGTCASFGPQSLDDLSLRRVALVPRLQTDEHAAGVDAGAGTPADRGADRRHVRILQNDCGRSLLQIGHSHKGDVRGCFSESEDHPGILLGEEPLRYRDDQQAAERDQGEVGKHRREPKAQDELQGPLVAMDQTLECALAPLIQAAVPDRLRIPQKESRHHRRQGQSDQRREDDRDGDGHPEFPEQPPDNAAHEQ